MYKNLRETISKDSEEKTVIQSRVVVPKKHFVLVINCREQFFQSTVFHESIAANHSSMDTQEFFQS